MGTVWPMRSQPRSSSSKPDAASSTKRGKPRLPRVLSVLIAMLALTPAADAAERGSVRHPPAHERRYVANEVLIQVARDVPVRTVDALARRLRLERIASHRSTEVATLRWRIPDRRSVPAVIRSLAAQRIVLAAQPNYFYGPQREARAAAECPPAAVSAAPADFGPISLAQVRLPPATASDPRFGAEPADRDRIGGAGCPRAGRPDGQADLGSITLID
jgi:hypothetical protein